MRGVNEDMKLNHINECQSNEMKNIQEEVWRSRLSKEDEELWFKYNDVEVEYPFEKTMHQIVEEQVQRSPDNVALIHKGNEMTYRELNEKANMLAWMLKEKGIESRECVGIVAGRSFNMILGMLAILKAGGIYVPIDPDYPKFRMKYIMENSKVSKIITDEHYDIECENVINIESSDLSKYSKENLNLEKDSNDLAYIIYTSGSTGMPKGVMIRHHSAVNLITWVNKKFTINSEDKVLFITSMCFDLSVYDIFGILAAGAKVVIAEKDEIQNPRELIQLIERENITFWDSVPTTMNHLINEIEISEYPILQNSLRVVFMSGDWIPTNLPRRIKKYFPKANVISLGGATEGTIWSIYYPIEKNHENDNSVPYGIPIDNNQMFVLDKNLNIAPVGEIGEIYIGGVGVAEGYMNDEVKTENAFKEDHISNGKYKKIYKTGDMGRMMSDGNMEFLGRIDHQVKIRGYRIELGEIENQVLSNENIKEAVVVDETDEQGVKFLNLYFVATKKIIVNELKAYLSEKLPAYMIPSYMIQIDNVPLTPNGKIDRKDLLKIDKVIETGVEFVLPSNEIEENLVSTWKKILGVSKVSVYDNFFDLGGYSLKATNLAHKIHKDFNVEIPLRVIFELKDLKSMAQYIEDGEKSRFKHIEKIEDKEWHEASAAQKRLYSISQLEGAKEAYNIPFAFIGEGNINIEKLENVITKIVKRHEAFRTSFKMIDDELCQIIHEEVDVKLQHEKIEKIDQDKIIDDFIKPFDLSSEPLVRFKVVEDQNNKIIFLIDSHHIISDGTSMDILIKEIMALYKGKGLKELEVQYKDFAVWQTKMKGEDKIKRQEQYWVNNLSGELQKLNLPLDYKRPAFQSFIGENIDFDIDKEVTEKLKEIARTTGSTLYMVLLAAYKTFLYKYTRQEDIIVGSVASGRNHSDIQSVIGMFVNTIIMRSYVSADKTFIQYLEDVKNVSLNAYENQDYQFDDLIKAIDIKRDMSRNPIFDTMFDYQNTGNTPLEIEGIKFNQLTEITNVAKFDLTINVKEVGEGLNINFEYCSEIFKEESIKRMKNHFKYILSKIADEPNNKLENLDMMSDEDKKSLIDNFNMTGEKYPNNRTIIELIEDRVNDRPENIAVVHGVKQITYKELSDRSNKIACELMARGMDKENIVGIAVKPSIEMIVGILGILKAGGAYLPIDPNYPQERVKHMLQDSKVQLILTHQEVEGDKFNMVECLNLDDDAVYNKAKCSVSVEINSKNLAYIIYTSGSTGEPKGVMVEHSSLVNLSCWHKNQFGVQETDRATKYAGFGFDASVWEIFPYLISGASIHMIDEETKLDIDGLNDYYNKNDITISFLPTQVCEQFMQLENKSLRYLLTGGDKLKYFENNNQYKLINNYGPTENTVVATVFEVEKNYYNIPIGKPISNTQAYIVDGKNDILAIGVVGELCLSGDSLARGYLNNQELTDKKFVVNPFNKETRMYKTGDLARWLPDGNIEFMGRVDQQVKVRGYRIELGEIEAQLMKCESVSEAVVVDREDSIGNKYLLGYFTSKEEVAEEDLKETLALILPDYMIPTNIIQIQEMPVNNNGKVDKNRLPKHEIKVTNDTKFVRPTKENEKIVAKVWSEVLGIDKIGIEDNFFNLGGDSIKAIQIISKLQKQNLKVEISDLLREATIKKLEKYIKRSDRKKISQEQVLGNVIKTPIQEWFFDKNFTEMNWFNQTVMIERKGGFEEILLEKVLNKIVEHHDALRMTYESDEDGFKQINRGVNKDALVFETVDISESQDKERAIKDECMKLQSQVDIANGALINTILFKDSDKDYLFIAIHHLVVDGISWRILLEDIAQGYEQLLDCKELILDEKTTSYKEWAQELKKYANSDKVLDQVKYWTKVTGEQEKLKVDREVETRELGNSATKKFELSAEKTNTLLKDVNRAYNTEINDVLLASLGIAIKKWQGMKSVTINMEGHGREDVIKNVDISRTVGWFTTQYPVKLKLDKENDIPYMIKSIKEDIRRIPFKGIGYQLLEFLTDGKNLEAMKFDPEIAFNYLGQFDQIGTNDVFSLKQFMTEGSVSPKCENPNKLNVNCIIIDEKLSVEIGHDRCEFEHNTIEEFSNLLKESLIEVIDHCIDKKGVELTPSDVTNVEMDLDEFQDICETYDSNGIDKIYKLTPMQQGMFIHHLKDPEASAYFEQLSMEIDGDIDKSIAELSFELLVKKYDILRTCVVSGKCNDNIQIVLKNRKTKVKFLDVSGIEGVGKEKLIEQYKSDDIEAGFDLADETLIRLSIIKVDSRRYISLWSFHHIIMDGWCLGIIFKDWLETYKAIAAGEQLDVNPVEDYGKYIQWLEDKNNNESKKYWMDYMDGYEEFAKIPFMKSNDNQREVEDKMFTFDEDITNKLNSIAKENNTTLSNIFQGIWAVLLQRYNNTNDVTFGCVVSGRQAKIEKIENMVGLFINTIPVRVKAENDITFTQLIKNMQESFIRSSEHSHYSLGDIQSITKSEQPLFDHIMAFENYPFEEINKSDDQEKTIEFLPQTLEAYEQTNYDMNLIISPGKEITLNIKFNPKSNKLEFIESIEDHFRSVVTAICENKDIKVSKIDIVSAKEKEKIVYEFNQTDIQYPKDKTIAELFKEKATEVPEKTAVVFKDNKISYKELDDKSTQVARYLRETGVKEGDVVGIILDSSIEIISVILGIVKIGAVYLPMDPKFPRNKMEYMIEDSNAQIIISSEKYRHIEFEGIQRVEIEQDEIWKQSNERIDYKGKNSDPVYIMYTSGTTGKSKGVVANHFNISRIVTKTNYIDVTDSDALLQTSNYAFDGSTFNIYAALLNGSKLVLVENVLEIEELIETIEKENVTVFFVTTQLFNMLVDVKIESLKGVRKILFGGEAASVKHVKKAFKLLGRGRISNVYGPTETTVFATEFNIDEVDSLKTSIPIGKSLSNTKIYVLDSNQNVQPIGIPGEIYVGGDGVVNGYLNKEKLSKEKFMTNTFVENTTMYRTGDIGTWLPDGNIEFINRKDNQIKLRGFRIELSEIEYTLTKIKEINEAVVMMKKNVNGDGYLLGYITTNSEISTEKIKEKLSEELPEYMIPSQIMFLEKMIVNSNGKIDKKKLPEPAIDTSSTAEYVAPRNGLEEKLVEIYQEVLGVEKVGIKDNFFELGGNSLKTTFVANKITKEFSVKVKISELFEHKTIEQVAARVKELVLDKRKRELILEKINKIKNMKK